MIDITLTDAALLIWGVVATSKWFEWRERGQIATKLLNVILNDEKERNKIIASFNRFKEKHHAN